jgi:hypothetical protein
VLLERKSIFGFFEFLHLFCCLPVGEFFEQHLSTKKNGTKNLLHRATLADHEK